ncbi:MAG TPA: MMPL family transporter [Solirubrobacteraceae bacterium]|nr:MMPL family transporter [Solirubrobacteraceae bacterium]
MQRVGRLEGLRVRGRERRRIRAFVLLALALAGAGIALTLTPSTALDTFVASSSADYRATQAMYRQFGSDPVVVLVRGRLTSLLQPAEIRTLSQLEACLGGQRLRLDTGLAAYVPIAAARARPEGGAGSACGRLMRARAAKLVYGPATFLNRAVAAVNTEVGSVTVNAVATIRAAEGEARTLAKARQFDQTQTNTAVQAAGELALEHELAAAEGSGKRTGASSAAGSATQGLLAGVPSIADPAFLRQIVYGSATSTSGPVARFAYLFPSSGAAIIQVRLDAGLSEHQQQQAIGWIRQAVDSESFRIPGVSYTVTGEPVLLSDLGSELSGQLILLLGVAVAVMALVLLAVLRRSLRLLPLATASGAVAITFGLTAVFGGSLTLADVAVFPVLLGLAVDYGVQFRSGTPSGAIASAALATAAGFLALLISPVPMVQGFGLLLVVGVVVAFTAAAFAGPPTPGIPLQPPRLIPQPLLASIYGAGEILSGLIPALLRHPRRVLATALTLAVAGWALTTSTAVQSDITKLVPAGMPALTHLEQLEHTTGTSGEVDVLVNSADVTSAAAVAWMRSYEQRMSSRFGAGSIGGDNGGSSSCAHATLCPALSLPSLLQTAGGTLSAVPGYFQRAVLTQDHHHALLAFGIRLMALSRQRRVIEQMRAALDPPKGTTAQLTGSPVLAADAEGSLASSTDRVLMILVSLALVAAALLAAFRDARRVLVPLIPIALATGWSALLVYILRIPLSPMSATLGTLVIAITTEFSVLLSERVGRQQAIGMCRDRAIDDAYRTTGIAVLTSALTAIAGFAVLVVSNITMLRDFGLLALVDLSVSLAGVMLVLPATLGLIDLSRNPAAPAGRRPNHAPADERSEPSLAR